MTSLSLRSRMVVTAIVAAGLALAVILWLASPRLEQRVKDEAYATQTAEARLIARVAETQLARDSNADSLDAEIDAAASDRQLSGEALRRIENHGDRPEVRAALSDVVGRSERHSALNRGDGEMHARRLLLEQKL